MILKYDFTFVLIKIIIDILHIKLILSLILPIIYRFPLSSLYDVFHRFHRFQAGTPSTQVGRKASCLFSPASWLCSDGSFCVRTSSVFGAGWSTYRFRCYFDAA